MMERIVQIVQTEKSVRKAFTRSGDIRGLIRCINMCCDLLFDDGRTSRAAGWSGVELAVWNLHGLVEPNLSGKWNLT